MTDHAKGLLITAMGVLLVVPDSLYVRLIAAEPMVIAFWRGLTAGGLILVYVLAAMGPGSIPRAMRAGPAAWIYAALIGSTTPGFVLAISQTSVANAVFIFAATPVFAAIYSRVFLGEAISTRMMVTTAVVIAGLGVIAAGSPGDGVASWKGDLWALYVSAAYAAALTAVRRVRDVPMIPMIPVAYIGASVVIGLFVAPWPVFADQWVLFLGHGAFIGVASCLLTLGPKYLSSAEVALLILLESVLAPILVWAVVGEDPGRWAIVGGVIVIGALVVSNWIALRRASRNRA